MFKLKACLHYATRLHATRRLRKVKGQRCCLQRGCLQYLLHVYTTQHGCCDEPLTGPQPTVWRHSCRHIFSRCDGRHVMTATIICWQLLQHVQLLHVCSERGRGNAGHDLGLKEDSRLGRITASCRNCSLKTRQQSKIFED